jgi:putative transposase
VVTNIHDAIQSGLSQKKACALFGIHPRKFRRWAHPRPAAPKTAWNKILPSERTALISTAWQSEFLGKPVSHLFVHGHQSGEFSLSLSTCYRVLKQESVIRKINKPKKSAHYISAHDLLDEGFSLLCYDATRFLTDSFVPVWAIPVILLPHRYLLHIGYALNSVTTNDLIHAVNQALAAVPESLMRVLVAHSDRGSAMKSRKTKDYLNKVMGIPVHFGRPHTPDDEAWIESFIKTLKYHREKPEHFPLVDDVLNWLKRFPDIYNNEPHSSLKYVTPRESLLGKKEVILSQRTVNYIEARNKRLNHYYTSQALSQEHVKEVVQLSI